MTNKIGKKNLALVLVFTLIFTAAFMGLTADKAEAASVKMNKSSVTLSLDKTTTAMLKAQGLSGKITWSVSDTKVLAVKSSGTKSAKITAKAAKSLAGTRFLTEISQRPQPLCLGAEPRAESRRHKAAVMP